MLAIFHHDRVTDMRLYRLLFDPAADAGGAATETQTDTKGTVTTSTQADPTKGYEAALTKHGNDAAAMARTVYADNAKLRADLAELTAKLPKDGAVILAGDEAKAWGEYAKLGSHAELTTKLEAGQTALASVAKFEREKLINQAAVATGYDPEVLEQLATVDLVIEVKEVTKLGKTTKAAEVVTKEKDDKGAEVEKRTPLDKFAEAKWAKFLPSLKATASASPRVGGTPVRQPVRTPTGTTTATTTADQGNPATRRRPSF